MDASTLRQDFFDNCQRYWPNKAEHVASLDVTELCLPDYPCFPPVLTQVALPKWAEDIAINGSLVVPSFCTRDNDWKNTDWPLAGAWYLHSLAEREYEKQFGPIHSYSLKLQKWPKIMWKYAWVNRIALFLRRWAAHAQNVEEDTVFGEKPTPQLILTFDVDAVSLAPAIRLKQGAFNLFNAFRYIKNRKWKQIIPSCVKAGKFLCGPSNEWSLSTVLEICEQKEGRAIFNFPAQSSKPPFSDFKRWLFDPGYDVRSITSFFSELKNSQHIVGLHPSFLHWKDAGALSDSRQNLENICGQQVLWCRQHWLRFSFADTWRAQYKAGILHDCTLGFNDVSGFRNGAALRFTPIDFETGERMRHFTALPLVFMDSQAYDYSDDSNQGNFSEMRAVISEVIAVGGVATILWHPHTLFEPYGWMDGFIELLDMLP